jgi:hypothetical protein
MWALGAGWQGKHLFCRLAGRFTAGLANRRASLGAHFTHPTAVLTSRLGPPCHPTRSLQRTDKAKYEEVVANLGIRPLKAELTARG